MIRRLDPETEPDEQGRMPYALPKGVPALQSNPAVTRRWLLAAFAGSIAATASVTAWLRTGAQAAPRSESSEETKPTVPPPTAPADPAVTWAVELARGPMEDLQEQDYTFLSVVERHPEHAELWRGVERLAMHVLAATDGDMRLIRRLHRTLSMKAAPADMSDLRTRLARRAEPKPRNR